MHHIEAACLYQIGKLQEAEKAIRLAYSMQPSKENYLNTYGVILRKIIEQIKLFVLMS